ncbi:MAG: hypothetical protein GVY24_04475 [Planctomycetes bacterium]|jgi:cell fate regulator YaaT (PSP1 superfamily)|nr:hypothetical protein [Planctomycetota bacterium]
MPGSITPLPVMLEEEDRQIYENLEPPKTIVVRYGYQKLIAELPYDGEAKPGCGSKLVIRSPRGTEIGEMLTTTCDNSGCAKSVSRQEMLRYIENSGGKDFPFTTDGKVLRVATVEDLNEQGRIDLYKPEYIKTCKRFINELGLGMELIEVELLLGNEKVLFYYKADQWVDFRELVRKLAGELQTRIEMVQVSDREEARLVADYEKCGQHCCCKQFLKVLKPVSMRSAKVQKATLDPQKISGRCGRLMCCLRYEDKTYSQLKKNLPHRKSVVETEDGIGIVLDTQILTQLALVRIGPTPPAAYPVENIRVLGKDEAKAWQQEEAKRQEEMAAGRAGRKPPRPKPWDRPKSKPGSDTAQGDAAEDDTADGYTNTSGDDSAGDTGGKPKRRRRRRGRKDGSSGDSEPRRPQPGQPLRDDEVESKEGDNSAGLPDGSSGYSNQRKDGQSSEGGDGKKRRRRRRRRRGGGGGGGEKQGGGDGGSGDG